MENRPDLHHVQGAAGRAAQCSFPAGKGGRKEGPWPPFTDGCSLLCQSTYPASPPTKRAGDPLAKPPSLRGTEGSTADGRELQIPALHLDALCSWPQPLLIFLSSAFPPPKVPRSCSFVVCFGSILSSCCPFLGTPTRSPQCLVLPGPQEPQRESPQTPVTGREGNIC